LPSERHSATLSPVSIYTATIRWKHDGGDFAKGQFSRAHTWSFDGGVVVRASASPQVLRPPQSDASAVDPEEAFVASIASCHMLTFLYVAGKQGFSIASYEDEATGTLAKNQQGMSWVSRVVLAPKIAWLGEHRPDEEQLEQLHAEAHHQCFIANSVKTQISVVAPEAM
jgi:organic hydroperoxide reductase OsmC/OhrA